MTALAFTLTLLSALAQADSEPQPSAVYRISGVVVDAVTSNPVAQAQVSISRDGEQISIVAGNDGQFLFKGLEAGKYSLSATAAGYLQEAYNQHGGFSVAIVTAEGQDTEHLVFRLHPQAVIYGRVTDEHGEAVRSANEWTSRSIEVDSRRQRTIDAAELPATAKVSGRVFLPAPSVARGGSVSLISTPETTLPGLTDPLQEDGTFNFSGVQPGTYRIQVNLSPGGYYVQKVIAKEAKASGREVTIAGGRDVDLTVTLGQGQGQVTGVVQSEGKPAAGVVVLLVPKSGQEMEEDSRMDMSDSDGTFRLGGILPGDCVLLAIKDGWDLEWSKSDVLRPYLSAGQKMSIAANQSVKVTVSAQQRTAAMEPTPR